jgi:retinol dehydrogenase-12
VFERLELVYADERGLLTHNYLYTSSSLHHFFALLPLSSRKSRFGSKMHWRLLSEIRSVVLFVVQIAAVISWLRLGWLPALLSWQTAVTLFGMGCLQRRVASGGSADLGLSSSASRESSQQNWLEGRVIVVTGSNTGIGLEAAKEFAKRGATVVFACRSESKCRDAMTATSKVASPKAKLHFLKLDLSDFNSVRHAATELNNLFPQGIDILVNNAGALDFSGASKPPLPNGHEFHVGTNFLGPTLFAELLLPLVERRSGRIIIVASAAHWSAKKHLKKFGGSLAELIRSSVDARKYTDNFLGYAASKAANMMFALHLAELCAEKKNGVIVAHLHPGSVASDIMASNKVLSFLLKVVGPLFVKLPIDGAQTTLHCALSPTIVNGGFYADCQRREDVVEDFCRDKKDIEKLMQWAQSKIQQL